MQKHMTVCAIVLGAVLLPGCNRVIIEGNVVNVQGEALPGVAVHDGEADYGRLTNTRGKYRLVRTTGQTRIRFSKTGYSPAELVLDIPRGRSFKAPTVEVWRLPQRAGVYVFDKGRYEETTWVSPKNFFMSEGGMAHATRREAKLVIIDSAPLIVCYNTPRYNARLSRMRKAKAKLGPGDAHLFEVLTAGGTIRVNLVPLDQPEGRLLKLRIEQPLEAGTYAVHWGALEGYDTIETKIFMFRIEKPARAAP